MRPLCVQISPAITSDDVDGGTDRDNVMRVTPADGLLGLNVHTPVDLGVVFR